MAGTRAKANCVLVQLGLGFLALVGASLVGALVQVGKGIHQGCPYGTAKAFRLCAVLECRVAGVPTLTHDIAKAVGMA